MKVNVDIKLIDRVKNGDEKAFTEVYKKTYNYVYFIALRICKNDDDAKEVTQLTFLQVHKSIHNLKDNRTFTSWLRRVVMSKCYNLFEHNRDSVFDPAESAQFRKQAEQRIYMQPQPQMRFESDKEVLMSLIDSLSEKYRMVLLLMHFEELSMDEIKDILNIPLGTVKSRLSTARKLLKEKVEAYEEEHQTHLDFHGLDPITLTTLYGAAYASTSVMIPTMTSFSSLTLFTKLKHIGKVGGMKAAVVGAVSVASGVGAVGLYQVYQHNQTTSPLPQPVYTSQLNYQEGEIVFKPVTIYKQTYEQAKDAYYALIQWAHCDVELQEKSEEEIQTYRILYNELKRSNGEYYQSLKKSEWGSYFENLLK